VIRRLLKILLAVVLLVILVLLGSGWWLLHTDSGSGWLVGRIVSSQNGTLGIDGFSGNLSAGARARSVVLTLDSGKLTISDLRLRLKPLILNPGVSIEELTSGKSSFNSAATPASISTDTGSTTALEGLPLRIELHSVSLGTLVVDESVIWDRLLLTADVEDRLNLDQLTITGPFGSAKANGFADLASPHSLSVLAEGELSGTLAGTAQPLIWSLDASGDTSRTQIKLQSQGPQFELAGNLREWDSAPVFDLHLHSPRLKWPLDSELPVVQLDDLNAGLTGPVTDFAWLFPEAVMVAV
jgi:autotransporter translocation and assembly factor TamB